MLKLLSLIIMLPFASSTLALAESGCDSQIEFRGATNAEKIAACASLKQVSEFFSSMGIFAKPKLLLVFSDEVFLPGPDKIPAYGYFDTDDNSIHLLHFDIQGDRKPWGFPWTQEFAISFLTHELIHLIAINSMGADFKRLPHHWHEFIAYFGQLALMDSALRTRILTYTPTSQFAAVSDVSAFWFEAAPELFALKSYLSGTTWGGKAFLKDLILGKIAIPKGN